MSKTRFAGILTGALLLFGGGVAVASIPASDGTINACYKNNGDDVKIIDSSASCPSGYTPLSWSQTGPAGPAGPAGADGASYDLGQTIANSANTSIPSGGGSVTVNATCPEGKVPTGGGYITQTAPWPTITKSIPTVNGWEVNGRNSDPSSNTSLQVFAICVNA